MAKVLVLGGSYLQSDFVEVALKKNHEVHVLDRNPYCYMSEWDSIVFKATDISDVDAVDKYFTHTDCDLVISPITEIGNKTAAFVAANHGLPYNSIETVIATTDKNEMRKRLEKSKLLEPKVSRLADLEDLDILDITYPKIVKPSISSASRGVTFVNNREELITAFERAIQYCETGTKILIEEYIEGEQYSIETISSHGQHHIVAIVKEELSGAPYYMERNDIISVDRNTQLLPYVEIFIEELLNTIGVTTGPCHTEVKIDINNNIRLIEVASRSGLLRDRLIRTAKGEEYNELILKSYLGDRIEIVKLPMSNALLGIMAYDSDFRVFDKAKTNGIVADSHLNGADVSENPTMLTDAVGYFFIQSSDDKFFDNYKVQL